MQRFSLAILLSACASYAVAICVDPPCQPSVLRADRFNPLVTCDDGELGCCDGLPCEDDVAADAVAAANALRLRGGEGSSWKTWWYKTLANFGIFLKNGRLLVLGLDNAGKSTLLTVLQRNEVIPTAPTHQPVADVIKVGHMKVRAVDMGGHEIARRMWLQYSHEADGIVYIVDAVDRERFEEAAVELHKLLAAGALPDGAPVLILANKVDLPHAATQEELWYGLGLDELQQSGSNRPIVSPAANFFGAPLLSC